MLKDKQFECDDYLAAAQGIDPASRAIQEIRELECFEKVCGEFFEVRVTGTDNYGEHSEETVLLKRDDGVLKVYWYRSKLMLANIRRENERIEEASRSPMQAAYGRLTEKYPALYQYPPCPDDLRASSSTLKGTPQREDELQSAAFEEWAQQCPDTFCLAMVGTKIAGLCP